MHAAYVRDFGSEKSGGCWGERRSKRDRFSPLWFERKGKGEISCKAVGVTKGKPTMQVTRMSFFWSPWLEKRGGETMKGQSY